MKIQLKQVEGNTFLAKGESNHWTTIDTSLKDGGAGAASGPMEMILMALAGCTAMDVVSILQKKRAGMTRLEINVAGERADDFPKVFKKIHITYIIHGKVRKEDAEHAVSLSQEKYCSVAGMLKKAVELTYNIQLDD
ncbi:MAG TPA: OsmC family protein [Candidatus Acidoferrales bacterium]|nr:OsmC family protein [Candidatus Acidoferrales bacterium]